MGFFSETIKDQINQLEIEIRLSIPSIWDFSLKLNKTYTVWEAKIFNFQFPLYGIFLWNRHTRSEPHSGHALSIPSIWDFSLKLSISKFSSVPLTVTFNSLYMGFFSETQYGHLSTSFPHLGHSFNSLYMGFFSETHPQIPPEWDMENVLSIPSIWDFSLKQFLVTSRVVSRTIFQFPLYGIFLWNAAKRSKGAGTLKDLLSIPSIWDFSLKHCLTSLSLIPPYPFNSLYMGFFSETSLMKSLRVKGSFTFNSLYMGFFSETLIIG